MLVVAFESADHPIDPWMERALEIARSRGGEVVSTRWRGDPGGASGGGGAVDSASTWRSAFLRMPYQRDILVRRSVIAETFETSCTWDRFDELHAAVTAAVRSALDEVCGGGVVTCRFTHVYPDGPAPYFGVYAPGRWDSLVSAHVAQWSAEGFVLVNEWGDQLAPWTLQRAIRTAREKVPGLPADFRFHDLRHYLASMLIASGADVKVVQARLRHASAKTTLDTSAHLWLDSVESTRTAIDAVMQAKAEELRGSAAE